jgi:hypothetical protein
MTPTRARDCARLILSKVDDLTTLDHMEVLDLYADSPQARLYPTPEAMEAILAAMDDMVLMAHEGLEEVDALTRTTHTYPAHLTWGI